MDSLPINLLGEHSGFRAQTINRHNLEIGKYYILFAALHEGDSYRMGRPFVVQIESESEAEPHGFFFRYCYKCLETKQWVTLSAVEEPLQFAAFHDIQNPEVPIDELLDTPIGMLPQGATWNTYRFCIADWS